MVLADHGGAPNSRGPEFLPIWLEDQGFLHRARPSLKARILKRGYDLANRTLTREQKQALARRFRKLREVAETESKLAGIDWKRTRAYADGRRDEVMVNTDVGRGGGRPADSDYAGLVEDLKNKLMTAVEAGTGRPAVDSVMGRTAAYGGPFVERAPDLTIRWRLDGPLNGLDCRTSGAAARMREMAASPVFQPGGHHPEGLFVASGPGVRPTTVRGRLQDVTPTILALLGAPVPVGLDGGPLPILVETRVDMGQPSALVEARGADESSGYTAEEEETIRRRLESLGYL
jgi:predicted AlkP superfamily phosphohydrolase/phosphomutase